MGEVIYNARQTPSFRAGRTSSPMSRDDDINQAKVYLAQARVAKFPGWRATLLEWAGRCRQRAGSEPVQRELFT